MRKTISFDFDGVLHIDMRPGTIHPRIWDHGRLRPRKQYINLLHKEAQQHDIVICSSRCEESRQDVEEFIEINRLPISEIYLTCMEPKIPFLMELEQTEGRSVIRHYDDDVGIAKQITIYKSNIQFIQVPLVTAEMAKGKNPYGECFKEFLSHEQPSKAKGFIDRKGSIHYHENPMGWIQFKRTNLEGSLKNSFWNVRIPVLNSRVKEALRIWALNMPEYYDDDVIIQNKGKTTVERIANFDFKFEPVSTCVTVVQLSIMPF